MELITINFSKMCDYFFLIFLSIDSTNFNLEDS